MAQKQMTERQTNRTENDHVIIKQRSADSAPQGATKLKSSQTHYSNGRCSIVLHTAWLTHTLVSARLTLKRFRQLR